MALEKIGNKDLIIVSLLESLIYAYGKPANLTKKIVKYLFENGILDDKNVLNRDYDEVKRLCGNLITNLITGGGAEGKAEGRSEGRSRDWLLDFSGNGPNGGLITFSGEELKNELKNEPRNALISLPTFPQLSRPRITYNNRYSSDFIEMEKIGRGGFGSVYKVCHNLDKNTYAVKKIKIKSIGKIQNNYLNEIIYMAKLSHQNIVRYYNTWIDLPFLYIQMELCDMSLETYFDTRKSVVKEESDKYFKEMVQGLAYIHSNNIIHGDFNPGNIFINGGVIKIGDFGLSHGGLDEYNLSYGNKLYMSPEQKEKKGCFKESDVYSLGIIYIELYNYFFTIMEKIEMIENIVGGEEKVGGLEARLCEYDWTKRITSEKLLNYYFT